MGISFRHFAVESDWRDESLRTNLWLIPAAESVAAVLLFVVTLSVDRAAFHGEVTLPSWVISGSPDAARQILSSLAAAIITVVGVVFSVMIVTLTLASSQFGPRMLRTFIRDRGTQLTLGTFVATFFYAMLALISIGATFVPHLSVTIALALTAVDLGVLIYFIHHTATAIQLPEVIASIARDLAEAIDAEAATPARRARDRQRARAGRPAGPAGQRRPGGRGSGQRVPALRQARHAGADRRGIRCGDPAAPPSRALPHAGAPDGHRVAARGRGQDRPPPGGVHITGPLRTLSQDIAFGIDQLVEIAIRALSPAVNDTFTALTCIDWLGDSLCQIAVAWHPHVYHRDGAARSG